MGQRIPNSSSMRLETPRLNQERGRDGQKPRRDFRQTVRSLKSSEKGKCYEKDESNKSQCDRHCRHAHR